MKVSLVDCMASDESVVRSAKVSTEGSLSLDSEVSEGLINFLMREKHASPFEHSVFTFLIEAPIFVAREIMRHRTASYNEQSGRYMILDKRFYSLDEKRPMVQVGKTSEYKFEDGDPTLRAWARQVIEEANDDSWIRYQALLDAGVAKEVARMVLPVATHTSFYMTVNARNLINFLSLRTAPNAQWETRQIANMMEAEFAKIMPITYNAWVKNGRNSL